jgi:hypothetical protein
LPPDSSDNIVAVFMTLAAAAGLAIWIILWSIGAKGFDAFIITALIVLVAATVKMIVPALSNRSDAS